MKAIFSSSTFLFALLCFLMPFVSVSCQGQELASISGLQMLVGADQKNIVSRNNPLDALQKQMSAPSGSSFSSGSSPAFASPPPAAPEETKGSFKPDLVAMVAASLIVLGLFMSFIPGRAGGTISLTMAGLVLITMIVLAAQLGVPWLNAHTQDSKPMDADAAAFITVRPAVGYFLALVCILGAVGINIWRCIAGRAKAQ